MKKVLLVEASPRGKESVSRKVGQELIEHLRQQEPLEIKVKDLDQNPLPHVGGELVQAYFTPPENRTPELREAIKASDQAVDELLESDVIVITTPMWNFNVPSVLKAWIDHISRAGRTFSFASGKLEGLVKNKKVYLVVASGSVFSQGPFAGADFVVPYFKTVLGFLGMTDVHVVRAEGLNDPAVLSTALDRARSQFVPA